MTIPRIIHQVFVGGDLPTVFEQNLARLQDQNPAWQHRFYGDREVRLFLKQEYGDGILARYERISPDYAAARSDFFRYLAVYRQGGIYLDVKSAAARPLDEIVRPDDSYLLSHWRNAPGDPHAGWGVHPELAGMPLGEFQQWFVAASPGHPFLKNVIERVVRNIDHYSVVQDGVGQHAVWRVTGPIAYTLAIAPIAHLHPARRSRNEVELGLIFSTMENMQHRQLFKSDYASKRSPLIRLGPLRRLAFPALVRLPSAKARIGSAARRLRGGGK